MENMGNDLEVESAFWKIKILGANKRKRIYIFFFFSSLPKNVFFNERNNCLSVHDRNMLFLYPPS